MLSDRTKKNLVYLHGLDVTHALCHYAGRSTRSRFCQGNQQAAKAAAAAAAAEPPEHLSSSQQGNH